MSITPSTATLPGPWRACAAAGVIATATLLLSSGGLSAQAGVRTIATFAEHVQYTLFVTGPNTGFNGQNNSFFVTSDGQYRIEAFWNGNQGHLHTVDPDLSVFNESGTDQEENHNDSANFGLSNAQGIRITRVDGRPFTLVGMDLHGGVAVGTFPPGVPANGTWRLYTGELATTGDPKADLRNKRFVSFGSRYQRVVEIFLADPFLAGASGSTYAWNAWDNIVLEFTGP
jgi:hypothetical protein